MRRSELQDVEVQLFIEAMRLRHGYDFSRYARSSMKRRVLALPGLFGVGGVADLLPLLLRDPGFAPRAVAALSVPVSEFFRDPEEFRLLREQVIPELRSWPRIVVWQAGCATGEEVYSLAILLREEGLYERCQVFATDINDGALAKAEEGVYPLAHLRAAEENYHRAGGPGRLSDYYQTRYDFGLIDASLRRNVVFAHHNLVSDGVFCEVHLILCRNVFIYFDKALQNQVMALFASSFARGGFLCLGAKEGLDLAGASGEFRPLVPGRRIYRYQPALLPADTGATSWTPGPSS
jgi:chemotaxis protein methyltransferase CheR